MSAPIVRLGTYPSLVYTTMYNGANGGERESSDKSHQYDWIPIKTYTYLLCTY